MNRKNSRYSMFVVLLVGAAFVLTAPNNPNLHAGQPTPIDRAVVIPGVDAGLAHEWRDACSPYELTQSYFGPDC